MWEGNVSQRPLLVVLRTHQVKTFTWIWHEIPDYTKLFFYGFLFHIQQLIVVNKLCLLQCTSFCAAAVRKQFVRSVIPDKLFVFVDGVWWTARPAEALRAMISPIWSNFISAIICLRNLKMRHSLFTFMYINVYLGRTFVQDAIHLH